jgi:hypothetical protein
LNRKGKTSSNKSDTEIKYQLPALTSTTLTTMGMGGRIHINRRVLRDDIKGGEKIEKKKWKTESKRKITVFNK